MYPFLLYSFQCIKLPHPKPTDQLGPSYVCTNLNCLLICWLTGLNLILQASFGRHVAKLCPMLRPVLNALGYAQKYCYNCGQAGPMSDQENFVHCEGFDCTGK